jgi:hypothetical protein
MITTLFVGLLLGALLGLVVRLFRLSALAAPSVAILAATLAYGVYQDHSYWLIALAMALNLTALQLGYLAVLVIEFWKSPESQEGSSGPPRESGAADNARPFPTIF